MSEDLMDLQILGVKLGTATGWDEVDNYCLYFYNPKFNEVGMKFLCGLSDLKDVVGISVSLESGNVELYTGENAEQANPVSVDWSVFNR